MLIEGMAGFDRANEAEAFDALASAGDPRLSFVRARWFAAGASPATKLFCARRSNGEPLAAFGLVPRSKGPLHIAEVGGCYWPARSVSLARDATVEELSAAMAESKALGRTWRLGPVSADDPGLPLLRDAARETGYTALTRPLGTLFELDLARQSAGGDWPSVKTQRKNRWRKRRLEEDGGELRIEYFTGADWTPAQRDAMALIETKSWLGKLEGGGDTKFRDLAMRRYWEDLCDDPVLASMLFGSLLWIGETPAAFTFGVEAGDTRYYIANNFDENFTKFGPGRVLLYDDFARASDRGIARVSWGLGDAGYKSEMGAEPGPELLDLLFVRGKILPQLLRPVWERGA